MQFCENRPKPSIRENSLKSSCDIESALPLLLRAKARERAAAVHGSWRAERRDETGWKLDCSLGSASHRAAQGRGASNCSRM